MAILLMSCDPQKKIAADLLTEHYPDLYEAIYNRDAAAIMEFTNHDEARIRTQAWNALINTPVDDIDALINLANKTNSKESWSSLWFKKLNDEQIQRINSIYENQVVKSEGLISLLGQNGNLTSFQLLLNTSVPNIESIAYELAFAIGKLSGMLKVSVDQQIQIIERALSTDDGKLVEAYLYGFYRARNNPEKQQLSDKAKQTIIDLWGNFYPNTVGADQYVAALLINDFEGTALYHFVDEDFLVMDVQLAIELIRGIAKNEKNDAYASVALNAFLEHKNPNVVLEALNAISSKPEIAKQLNNRILNETALNKNAEDRVRLAGFNTTIEPEKYVDDLVNIGTENPYVQNLRYSALQKVWDNNSVFEYLVADIDTSSGLLKSFLLTELNNFWANIEDEFKTDDRAEIVRNILFKALKNGESANTFYALFSDEKVLRNRDFDRLISMLDLDAKNENAKVAKSVTFVLKNRFEERSNDIVSQLFDGANKSLQETLIAQDWSVIDDTSLPKTFRSINWKRLAKLGPNPIWVLKTKKGSIEIKLDVLTAPATISGMDSLINAGAYNMVAFHRVVPNFVIQGGDVETGRGNGGPGYVVPTEASANHFNRGAAGIASSGIDTEGSQYFMMNSWAPHLNGRYTLFGEVISGMSVVDRITVGDVITKSYWK